MTTHPLPPARRRPSRAGFTLIEATISVVIVGVVLVAALNVAATTARMRHVRTAQDRGVALAHDLMSEIAAARFQEPDDPPLFGPESPESGGDRAVWDDVDDYHGWSASPPQDKDGVAIAGTEGWTRSVTVANVLPGDLSDLGVSTPDPVLRWIQVLVRAPDGTDTTLSSLRSVRGAYEQPPPIDTTYVTRIGIDLTVGADPSGTSGSVTLVNHIVGGP